MTPLVCSHLDLFSGIGGFSIAMESCGFKTVAFSEIDRFASRVLAYHWPDVPNLGDITQLDGKQIYDQFGDIGVVTFGSPCQDLSIAGKRAGLGGERSSLFHEAVRVIRDLRPAFAIWENVAGAFSSGAGWDFAAVLDSLAECGALDLGWRVLDAQFAGVPQRRDRIFLVADFRGRRAGEILSLTEGVRGDFAARGKAGEDVARCVATGTNGQRYDWETETFAISGRAEYREGFGTLRANGGDLGSGSEVLIAKPISAHHGRNDLDNDTYVTPILQVGGRGTREGKESARDGLGIGKPGDPMFTLGGHEHGIMFDYKQSGETDPTMRALSHDQSHANGGGHLAVALSLDVNKSANEGSSQGIQVEHTNALRTDKMPAVSKGNMGVRRLTPTECERLMGFEDGWTALPNAADGPRYRALGNAVVPCVVRQIAERMSRAVEAPPKGTETSRVGIRAGCVG